MGVDQFQAGQTFEQADGGIDGPQGDIDAHKDQVAEKKGQEELAEAAVEEAAEIARFAKRILHQPVPGLKEKEGDAQDADALEGFQTAGIRQQLGEVMEYDEQHEESPQGQIRFIGQRVPEKLSGRGDPGSVQQKKQQKHQQNNI